MVVIRVTLSYCSYMDYFVWLVSYQIYQHRTLLCLIVLIWITLFGWFPTRFTYTEHYVVSLFLYGLLCLVGFVPDLPTRNITLFHYFHEHYLLSLLPWALLCFRVLSWITLFCCSLMDYFVSLLSHRLLYSIAFIGFVCFIVPPWFTISFTPLTLYMVLLSILMLYFQVLHH